MFNEMGGDEYELSAGYVVTKCYDDFPTIHILFSDKWIAIDPRDYVVDISDNQDRSMCVLLMSEGEQPFFIMGLPLYMDYYTVHDDDNNRIGFAPKIGSSKTTLVSGTKPARIFESLNPNDYPVSNYSWYASALLMFLFIIGWCCAIVSSLRKRSG